MSLRILRKDCGFVVEVIEDVFATGIYPGDYNLVTGDTTKDPEAEWIYQNLKGKNWKQLLHELENLEGGDLYRYHIVYSFTTPDAYCYYLPAYLIVSLDFERVDTVGDYLLSSLTPPTEQVLVSRKGFFTERLERLTQPQREAIGLFLNYLSSEVDIKPATIYFWKQFVHIENLKPN